MATDTGWFMRSPRAWRAACRTAASLWSGPRRCPEPSRQRRRAPRGSDARRRAAPPRDPRQRARQRRRLDRLRQIVVHARREAVVAVAGHRVGGQRDDRHRARPAPAAPGSPASPRGRRAPASARPSARRRSRRRAAAATAAAPLATVTTLCPPPCRKALIRYWLVALSSASSTRSGGMRPPPAPARRGARPRGRRRRPRRGSMKREDAAHARRARTAISPPISSTSCLADREPEAGAAGAPGQRVVDLHELLEDLAALLGGDADAGVARPRPAACRRPRRRHSRPAPRSSPASVNLVALLTQVGQDLAQPHRVGRRSAPARASATSQLERDALLRRRRRHQRHHLARSAAASRPPPRSAGSASPRAWRSRGCRSGSASSPCAEASAISARSRCFAAAARRASARAARAPRSSASGSRGSSPRGSATSPASPPRPPAGAGSSSSCRSTSAVTSQTSPTSRRVAVRRLVDRGHVADVPDLAVGPDDAVLRDEAPAPGHRLARLGEGARAVVGVHRPEPVGLAEEARRAPG